MLFLYDSVFFSQWFLEQTNKKYILRAKSALAVGVPVLVSFTFVSVGGNIEKRH